MNFQNRIEMEASDRLELSDYLIQEYLPLRQGKPWTEEDQQKVIASIAETLSEMAFKKSQFEKDIESARTAYLKRLEMDLRRCFLKKFRFPMKLARGTFIRYVAPSGANVFSYEGRPFAVEKQGFEIKLDSNKHTGIYHSCLEPIIGDPSLLNIIRTYNLTEGRLFDRYANVVPKIF